MGLKEGSKGDAKEALVAASGGMKRNEHTFLVMKKESGDEDRKDIQDLKLCGHSKHLWTERERRKKMKIMFQDLQALLPYSSPKEYLTTIVDEAIAYIKTLEETLHELEKQKLEKLHASSSTAQLDTASHPRIAPFCFTRLSPPPVIRTWSSPNVSLDVCGVDGYISICSSKKSQLFTRICFVLEKYKIDVISTKISSDKYKSMFFFHVQANADDEVSTASRYEELLKKAGLEIVLLVNSKSSTTSAVDLEEFCEKHYEKLLPIMADKHEYEQRKKEKLDAVKARLEFGEVQKKTTRAQESAYSESGTMSPRRQRRSHSPHHNPSVFTRLRRERSRSPRHEYKDKARKEGTVFKRLGSRGRSTSMYSNNRQESSRYMKGHSKSEDSGGGHCKSKSRRKKSSVEDDDLSQPWAAAKIERWVMPTWCHMFNSTLTGNARVWFDDLPPESIDSYNDLREAFLKNYLEQKKCIRDPIVLHNIRKSRWRVHRILHYKGIRSEVEMIKGARIQHEISDSCMESLIRSLSKDFTRRFKKQ
ncbi:reverse transcriptase domain-containing protein [Tanacetum coccineum]|uniref:Reverse transcriptase domain-containing protein n=1 Tax=Tanacetum coccineum TaxID=301880 RepID=A0ABQ4ZZR1_9ASTR